jgi:hypothetical protein
MGAGRDPDEPISEVGELLLQPGQGQKSNSIPGHEEIGIGGILGGHQTRAGHDLLEEISWLIQEWPHHRTVRGSDSRQPFETRSEKQTQHDGFGLIISVVCRHEVASAKPPPNRFQMLIAEASARRFQAFTGAALVPDRDLGFVEWEGQGLGQHPGTTGSVPGSGIQAMVDVEGQKSCSEQGQDGGQAEEQGQ